MDKNMAQKSKDKCQDCAHLKRKEIYKILAVALVIILAVVLIPVNDLTSITGRWLERERHSFAISAAGLGDGSGNAIDIRGAGKVGMSGWIMFWPVGDFNLTLWAKGSGTIALKSNGKEFTTKWKPIENYGYTQDWIFMRIRLDEPTGDLPMELNVELAEGTRSTPGSITLSTGPYTYMPTSGAPESTGPYNTYANLELTHTGVVYRGTGLVVIN